MIQSLKAAGESLRASLNHYVSVCSSMRSCSSDGLTHQQFSREIAHQLEAELMYFASYETNIQKAKRDIVYTRNYLSPLVPINTLPSEILTRIFSLVASPCNLHIFSDDNEDENDLPKYPENLLSVCSRWNRTILSTPSLWAHIDLTPDESYCQAILTRAQCHSERAGGLPLHIHIVDSEDGNPENDDGLYGFFGSIVDRMKTLEFDINHRFDVDHTLVFQELLGNDTTNFTELIIRSHSEDHFDAFIASTIDRSPLPDVDSRSEQLSVNLPQEEMEEGFGGLKLLHLQGIFPYWASNAYYGLVDLRLTSSSSQAWSSINQCQLARILQQCPKLQILHLALIIKDIKDMKPIDLRELEVINLSASCVKTFGSSTSQLASMLRLLAPGSRPLRLTWKNGFYDEPLLVELREFFIRSVVVNLCVKRVYPPLQELLHLAPSLRTLVFESCAYGSDPCAHIARSNRPIGTSPQLKSFPHLITWHVLNCEVSLSELGCMVGIDKNKTLVLSECTFINYHGRPNRLSDMELLDAFPSVRFIPDSIRLPNPTADWDFLGW